MRTKEKVAIKVEAQDSKYPQLLDEFKVYSASSHGKGVPKVFWCGKAGKCNVMAMQLLGDSLEMLYNKCGRKFSLKTVLMLAVQLIDRIEHHHKNHYLHRDIKPDNFLMGCPPQHNVCFLIDMGLCKQFRDANTLLHIPYKEHKKLIGTPRYASISTHQGIEQCRRDDLESIGYMLMYFNLGKLPWQGLKAKTKQEKYAKISSKKISTDIEQLCKDFPDAFAKFLHYTRQLKFTGVPDYNYLRGLFINLYKKMGFKNDGEYDWHKLPEFERIRGPPCELIPEINPPPPHDMEKRSTISEEKSMLLMQAYSTIESERDSLKRKYEEKERHIAWYKNEILKLKRHIAMYSTIPYPVPGGAPHTTPATLTHPPVHPTTTTLQHQQPQAQAPAPPIPPSTPPRLEPHQPLTALPRGLSAVVSPMAGPYQPASNLFQSDNVDSGQPSKRRRGQSS